MTEATTFVAGAENGEGRLEGAGGCQLYCRWSRPSRPRGAVAVVHGLGEHSGRYQNLAQALVDAQFAYFGYDQRGYGQSGGPRGDVHRFADYSDDLKVVLGEVSRREPGMPLFLFGHSLGGVVAVLCALEEQTRLSGLVTSSGAFRPAHIPSKPAFLAARILSPIVPHLKLSGGLKPELLSHDPKVVANYQADPLVQSEVTIRWGVEFFGAYEQAISRAGELSLPLLVMQGEADGIATLEGARAFFAQAGSADKKLRTYPGLRHELFNELPEQRRHVLADLTQWLVAHVEAR